MRAIEPGVPIMHGQPGRHDDAGGGDADVDVLEVLLRLRALGSFALSRCDAIGAVAYLAEAIEIAEGAGIVNASVLRIHADAVEALIGVGDVDGAAGVLAGWETQVASAGSPWARATSARCRALVYAARGDLAAAELTIAGAVRQSRRLAAAYEHGRTLLVAGRIYRRATRKDAARRSFGRAAAIFEQLGMVMWAQQARAEQARVLGPRTAAIELTATERRVAELAASGRTNRDVAQALFMSPKTVEAHLSRAYRKLAIRSRAELGALFGTAALATS